MNFCKVCTDVYLSYPKDKQDFGLDVMMTPEELLSKVSKNIRDARYRRSISNLRKKEDILIRDLILNSASTVQSGLIEISEGLFPPPWNMNEHPEKTEGWIEFQKAMRQDPKFYGVQLDKSTSSD